MSSAPDTGVRRWSAPWALAGAVSAAVIVLAVFALVASGALRPDTARPPFARAVGTAASAEPVSASALDDGHGGQFVTLQVTPTDLVPQRISARSGTPLVVDVAGAEGARAVVVFAPSETRVEVGDHPVSVRLPAMAPGLYTFRELVSGREGRLVVR